MSPKPLCIEQLHKTFYLGLFAPIPWARTLKLGPLHRVVQAVRGVSFEVEPGEIFGLLGANGAGKSTTIKCAMGLIRPSEGEVRLRGRASQEPEARRGVGYLPESPVFYDELTPVETLELFGALCGIPGKRRRAEALKHLARVGMSGAIDRPLRSLSKGMHQRVGVAQALLGEPELLILDEPLSGLDPVGRRELRDVLLEERARGASILLSSHILPDVEALCDRFAMIHQGELRHLAEMSSLATHVEEVTLSFSDASEALIQALEGLGGYAKGPRARSAELTQVTLPAQAQREALALTLEHEATLTDLSADTLSLDALFERLVHSADERHETGGER